MKYVFFCVVFILNAILLNAQEDSLSNAITIKVPPLVNNQTLVKTIAIPLGESDNVYVDIKKEFWDTTVYNPYKNTVVNYPLNIKFNDTSYSSPIFRKKVITSRYGWRRGRPHRGIDIDLITGDSVVSILDGVVRFAKYSYGHGKTVVVRHYNGLETTYAHLSKISVKPNDSIKKGDLIGKGGNTGNSRGSHLHLVVSYKGEYIHPEYIFDFSETNAIRAKELWVTKKWTRPQYHNSRRLSQLNILKSQEEALASIEKPSKVYVVQRGDTLYRISRRNNVSITAICSANAIKKTSTLRVGQKLVIEP